MALSKYRTSLKNERRNVNIFLLFSVTYLISANMCSEGYIQTYLMKLGFGISHLRDYGVICQIISISAYVILTRMPFFNSGLKRTYAIAVACMGIFPAFLTVAWYIPLFPVLYAAVLFTAALYSFLGAFKAVVEFNMIPYLFPRILFGDTLGKSMVIGGVITLFISVGAGYLSGQDGTGTYALIFGTATATLIISALISTRYKPDSGETDETPPNVKYSDVIKTVASARYRKLLLPHFLRGAGMAGMYYIIPAALERITLTDSERSYLIAISVLSTTIGSLIFMRLSWLINSGNITFAATITCSVLMPLLVVQTGIVGFYILYFIFFTSNMISQVSIPTGVMRSTPNNELRLITPMRLLLTSSSMSLFIYVFGILLKQIASLYIMLLSSIIFILCGFMFKRLFDDRLQYCYENKE